MESTVTAVIDDAVSEVLEIAAGWLGWDGRPVVHEGNAWTPHKALRRVADHLLADTGHALVLVTHDLVLARRCDAAVLFAEGSVSAAGAASGVVDAYERALAC